MTFDSRTEFIQRSKMDLAFKSIINSLINFLISKEAEMEAPMTYLGNASPKRDSYLPSLIRGVD
jgi:hypothetical protein